MAAFGQISTLDEAPDPLPDGTVTVVSVPRNDGSGLYTSYKAPAGESSDGTVLRNTVYPEDMDSWDPDDPTAAFEEAMASGSDVLTVLGTTYNLTADVVFSVNGQSLSGGGTLNFIGDCGVVVPANIVGAKITGLNFEAPAHTGWAIKVLSGHRTFINDINCIDVFSFLYIEGANTTIIDDFWATVRGKGIVWYGNDTLRSDILIIDNGTIGHSDPLSTEYGLDWNGNCHSLSVHTLGIVSGGGFIIRNVDGVATFPAIGRFVNFQSDYSTRNGIRIDAGLDYDIVAPYILGSANSGIYIAAAINNYEVRITAGKSVGSATRYGIENPGGVVLFSGNTALYSNFLGEVSVPTSLWTKASRLNLGENVDLFTTGGNLAITGDTNDYITYDKAANVWRHYIGAGQRFGVYASGAGVNFATLAGTSFAVTNPSGNCAGTISNAGAGSGAITGTGTTDFWRQFRCGGNYVRAGGESKKAIAIPSATTLTTEVFTGALTNATFESLPQNPLNPHWWVSEGGCLVGPETALDDTTQYSVFAYGEVQSVANGADSIVGPIFRRAHRGTATGSGSFTRYLDYTGFEASRTTAGIFSGGAQFILFGVGPTNAADWTAPVVPYLQPACLSLNLHGTTGMNAFTFPKMNGLLFSIDHNSGNYTSLWDMKSVVQQVGAGGTIGNYIYSAVYFRNGGGGVVAPTNNTGYAASTTLDDKPASGNYFLWNNTTYQSYLGGALEVVGKTTLGAAINTKAYTVATLPGTPATGDAARVTDAAAPTFGSTVAGGGAVNVPVFYDGTNWIVA